MGDLTKHTPQDRYSALVLAKLRRQLVLKEGIVFNTKYEGNPTAGAVKIPVRDTEVKTREYDKANGIAGAIGSTTYLTVTVDHDEAVNEIIDGYDAAAVPDNLVADRLDSAGYALAESEDADAGRTLIQNSTIKYCEPPTEDNVYKLIVAAKTALSKAKVPNDNRRYLLATPETMALILTSKQFTDASSLGDEVKQSGIVGRIAGFNVIEWLPGSLDPDEDEANYDGLVFIVGHPDFATKVREFSVPVYLADLKNSDKYIGACAVKGRSVYTHKVLRENCILTYFAGELDDEDEEENSENNG